MKRALLVLVVIAAGWFAYEGLRARARLAASLEAERTLDAIVVEPPAAAVHLADETEVFGSAAERAWAFVDSHYEPMTGMTKTVPDYPVATTWDVGSMLAAYFSAREIGLIDRATYDLRVGRLLGTLASLPLFDGVAFNKTYGTASGRILARNDSPAVRGYGWSTTDLGRLLIWLRVIAERDPAHAAAAERVARRIDMDRIVRDGYLWGEEVDRRGRVRRFREGFIGYEQYAAQGFAFWSHEAVHASSLTANTEPMKLWDVVVLIDRRPRSCLTSEPFILAGLEFGWSPDMKRLALAVLETQAARYRRTGRITAASEDASTVAPWHFYYYCVWGDAGPFSLAVHGGLPVRDGPLTVSAKAAFAWYALMPTEYTALVLDAVAKAWAGVPALIAGIDETTANAKGPPNINTAAVILESALYRLRGHPILEVAVHDVGAR